MIDSIKNTSLYKSLNLNKSLHHAYLFYSIDKELNNNIALSFAKSLICEKSVACNECFGCIQFNSNSHPDLTVINQDSIKVEDANNIISKLNTKPISNKYKVFVILNAENINEIAQNKLLKSLEEPNPSNIFILTCAKTDKLLLTIMSRLHKVNVPKLNNDDKNLISYDLMHENINMLKYLNMDISLTDIYNFENNETYKNTLENLRTLFSNLKSSQDIPSVASKLSGQDKNIFFPLLQKLFLCAINNENFIDNSLVELIKQNYPQKALIKCLPYIEDAYKKLQSNVNFGYILDNLLFNILKEKFLCKQ